MTIQNVFGYVPIQDRLSNRTTVPDPDGRRVRANSRDTVAAAARWVIWYTDRLRQVDTLRRQAMYETDEMLVAYIQISDRLAAAADAMAMAMDSYDIISVEQLSPVLLERFPRTFVDDETGESRPLTRADHLRAFAALLRSRNRAICREANFDTGHAQVIDYRASNVSGSTMGFLPALIAAQPIGVLVMGTITALAAVVGIAYVLTMSVDQLLNFFDRDRQSATAAVDIIRDTVQRQLRTCAQIEDVTQRQQCIANTGAQALDMLEQANRRINRGFDKYFGMVIAGGAVVAGIMLLRGGGNSSGGSRRRRWDDDDDED